MIRSIKFCSLAVRDQESSLRFYTEKLGFKVLTDQPMGDGKRWIELKIPGGETGLVLFTPPGHEDRIGTFTGISFVCDDVETFFKTMSKQGVEFEGPPDKQPWGTFLKLKDIDGNVFVVSSR